MKPGSFDNLTLPTTLDSVMGDDCTAGSTVADTGTCTLSKTGHVCGTARCEQGNWNNPQCVPWGEFIHLRVVYHVRGWGVKVADACQRNGNAMTHCYTPLNLLVTPGLKHQFVCATQGSRCNE